MSTVVAITTSRRRDAGPSMVLSSFIDESSLFDGRLDLLARTKTFHSTLPWRIRLKARVDHANQNT